MSSRNRKKGLKLDDDTPEILNDIENYPQVQTFQTCRNIKGKNKIENPLVKNLRRKIKKQTMKKVFGSDVNSSLSDSSTPGSPTISRKLNTSSPFYRHNVSTTTQEDDDNDGQKEDCEDTMEDIFQPSGSPPPIQINHKRSQEKNVAKSILESSDNSDDDPPPIQINPKRSQEKKKITKSKSKSILSESSESSDDEKSSPRKRFRKNKVPKQSSKSPNKRRNKKCPIRHYDSDEEEDSPKKINSKKKSNDNKKSPEKETRISDVERSPLKIKDEENKSDSDDVEITPPPKDYKKKSPVKRKRQTKLIDDNLFFDEDKFSLTIKPKNKKNNLNPAAKDKDGWISKTTPNKTGSQAKPGSREAKPSTSSSTSSPVKKKAKDPLSIFGKCKSIAGKEESTEYSRQSRKDRVPIFDAFQVPEKNVKKPRKRAVNKNKKDQQPSISRFLSPKSPKLRINIESINQLLASPPCEDADETLLRSIKSIDELKNKLHENIKEYEKLDKEFHENEKERLIFVGENIENKSRLHSEFNNDKIKEWFRENKTYIQDVWDGKIQTDRYKAFHKDSRARQGLLYHIVTDPFSKSQLDLIHNKIAKIWMPTEELKLRHSDFVWKVILTETLIKIYGDFFKITQEEAERRMRNTPEENNEED